MTGGRPRYSPCAPAASPRRPRKHKPQRRILPAVTEARITAAMMRFFDMDDRARLPWRFFGECRPILARA